MEIEKSDVNWGQRDAEKHDSCLLAAPTLSATVLNFSCQPTCHDCDQGLVRFRQHTSTVSNLTLCSPIHPCWSPRKEVLLAFYCILFCLLCLWILSQRFSKKMEVGKRTITWIICHKLSIHNAHITNATPIVSETTFKPKAFISFSAHTQT